MSRTSAARVENSSLSLRRLPNSFTSRAPDTLNRSVICVFIAALRSKPRRVIDDNRRPTRLAGMMNTGSTTSPMMVSRHSRRNIAVSVVMRTITLDTTEPRVVVTARWAPMTSLLSRLINAPVCVRRKNAMGMADT
jgi:hypothetical protein